MTAIQSEKIKELTAEVKRLQIIEKKYLKLIFRNDELISEVKSLRKLRKGEDE